MTKLNQDERFIHETIKLAKKAGNRTGLNPLVGAVVVSKIEGKEVIIGKGYHHAFGKPHAEINAIDDAKKRKPNLSGCTLYVTMEPCSHTGKTPPCTDRIIQEKIKRVVFGMTDPNPIVNGKGSRLLAKSLVEVTRGILKDECAAINESYIKYVTTGMPFVTVKVAQTLDGKIATPAGDSKWITSEASRKYGHKLRSQHQALVAGANTVKTDNPSLTVRLVKGHNPLRVIIDGDLRAPVESKIFNDRYKDRIVVITSSRSSNAKIRRLEAKKIPVKVFPSKTFSVNLKRVLEYLAKEHQVSSVLVEGGSNLFSGFLEQNLIDRLIVFIAPKIIGAGIGSFDGVEKRRIGDAVLLKQFHTKKIGKDLVYEINF